MPVKSQLFSEGDHQPEDSDGDSDAKSRDDDDKGAQGLMKNNLKKIDIKHGDVMDGDQKSCQDGQPKKKLIQFDNQVNQIGPKRAFDCE